MITILRKYKCKVFSLTTRFGPLLHDWQRPKMKYWVKLPYGELIFNNYLQSSVVSFSPLMSRL